MLDVVNIIVTKRDGGELPPDQVRALVNAFTAGDVPDYQMTAFLMAAFHSGLTPVESNALTEAMLNSGPVMDLSSIPGVKVDKHSTGGVGDKISLILAPVVAAAGVPVPMISGRGLGHTGGTLDKLDAIPGFRTDLSIEEYRNQLEALGVVITGQTNEIAPADKKLYALRDVTGTVEFVPFIAASIMSKKLAEGIDALVLDVKFGRGAFMKTEADARHLAETLTLIGERFKKRTVAWLTNMDQPLGYSIGNWPETHEAIRCLQGERVEDVMLLVEALAGEMIWLGGRADSPEAGREVATEMVATGAALAKFRAMVVAQGGDPDVVDRPDSRTPRIPSIEVTAPPGQGGFIADANPYRLGRLANAMGAGRQQVSDDVDPLAGITLLKKRGDSVQPGEPIARLHTHFSERKDEFLASTLAAISIGPTPVEDGDLLVDRFHEGLWDRMGEPVG